MASCMAFIRALRMSVASISSALTEATAHAAACWQMTSNRASRFFSVSFLLSSRPGMQPSTGRITAAAYTGPISGPAPASSQPHTAAQPRAMAAFSSEKSVMWRPPLSPV